MKTKTVVIFTDSSPKIKSEGYTFPQVYSNKINSILEDCENFEENFFRKILKESKVDHVLLDLTLGENDYLNLGLYVALIAKKERIPITIYIQKKESSLSNKTIHVLHGLVKKITGKEIMEVTGNDFSEIITEIEKVFKPVVTVS